MTLFALNLSLFAITVALVGLYGLSVSGHFPREFRSQEFQNLRGTIVIWATLFIATLAGVIALAVAVNVLPPSAIIISSGAMLLMTPLVLRPFPDWFVNGPIALISLAVGALLAAVVMWIVQ